MAIIHGSEDHFQSLVSENLVLVDFFATWCGPCKMLGPVLEELSTDRTNLSIVKINVDENPNLSKQYGVMSVPTLLLFKNGQVVATQSGFMPKEALAQWIESNR